MDHFIRIKQFLLEDGNSAKSKVDLTTSKDTFRDIVLRRVVKFLENEKKIIEESLNNFIQVFPNFVNYVVH